MFEALKTIHYLALLLGGAATVAPMIVQRAVAMAGSDGSPPAVKLSLRAFGLSGLVAIVLLWLSGLMMLSHGYDGAGFGTWFTIKLIAATAILLSATTLNILAARNARSGAPPNPAIVRPLTLTIRVSLVVAIIGAVLTFS